MSKQQVHDADFLSILKVFYDRGLTIIFLSS